MSKKLKDLPKPPKMTFKFNNIHILKVLLIMFFGGVNVGYILNQCGPVEAYLTA